MSETVEIQPLSPRQRQAARAREALAARFKTLEEKSDFYRQIGQRGNAGRATLRADDVAALRQAYALLDSIMRRLPTVDERSESAA